MATIDIEINGKKITTDSGKSIIQVADENHIYIPRFCYHKHLSVAANCRMCLVEVENGRKPMPACATPATQGMKVFTQSEKTRHSQKAVMEFLLINHPLDCPICDQGGQCDLQDLAMEYGHDRSNYTHPKHCVSDQEIGPLIATQMTRCIKCTRCVRFGESLAGLPEMGVMGRGETVEIGTYVSHFLQSEVSGNIIDLCPVGALLSKPFLYRARPWELTAHPTIAAHDCLGSPLAVHTRRGEVMRSAPRPNTAIHDVWLSDRDRFSYLGNNSSARLLHPMIKNGETWQTVSWARAFQVLVNQLSLIHQREGGEQIGALISPSATLEECYLLQKLLRALGSNNIDHRLRQTDFSDQADLPLYLGLKPGELATLATQKQILLIGSDIRQEQPIVALKLRQAIAQGGQVATLNVLDCPTHFPLTTRWIVSPNTLLLALGEIIHVLLQKKPPADEALMALVAHCRPSEKAKAIAGLLTQTKHPPLILLGALAHNHPEAAKIRQLVFMIRSLTDARIGFLTEGANSAGAAIAGALPHRTACGQRLAQDTETTQQQGLTAAAMIRQGLKVCITLGIEPELDCANSQATVACLRQANLTLCLTSHLNERMKQYANVILPMATPYENGGTFVNVEGRWQSFNPAARPQGEARPAWKILRCLASQLQLKDFDYNHYEMIHDELYQHYKTISPQLSPPQRIKQPTTLEPTAHYDSRTLQRISPVPLYATDVVVRHADALQQVAATQQDDCVRLHPDTAKYHRVQSHQSARLTQGEATLTLPVKVDERVPPHCLWVNTGIPATIGLGEPFGTITIEAVDPLTTESPA